MFLLSANFVNQLSNQGINYTVQININKSKCSLLKLQKSAQNNLVVTKIIVDRGNVEEFSKRIFEVLEECLVL